MNALKPPYEYDQRKYFNCAAGVRATDKNHKVAQKYFERIKRLEARGKLGQIVEEGISVAEKVRVLIAEMLNCRAENVIFSNSATGVQLSALTSIVLTAKSHINFKYSQDEQYPSTASPLILLDKGLLKESTLDTYITTPNYPIRPLGMDKILADFENVIRDNGWKMSPPKSDFQPQSSSIARYETLPQRRGVMDIFSHEHSSREFGWFNEIPDYYPSGKNHDVLFVFVDASQTFGLSAFDTKKKCDVYSAGSSKAVGGEPTVGVGCVTDDVLSRMLHAREKGYLPFVGMQFSPSIDPRQDVNSILSAQYWIALPELMSLYAALVDIKKFGGVDKVNSALSEKQKYLCKRLYGAIPPIHKSIGSTQSSYYYHRLRVERKFSEIIMQEFCDVLYRNFYDDRYSRYLTVTNLFANLGEDPITARKSNDFVLSHNFVPNAVIWQIQFMPGSSKDEIFKALTKEYCMTDVFSIVNTGQFFKNKQFNDNSHMTLRISLRHDVDQDIDGLVEALKRIYDKYGG